MRSPAFNCTYWGCWQFALRLHFVYFIYLRRRFCCSHFGFGYVLGFGFDSLTHWSWFQFLFSLTGLLSALVPCSFGFFRSFANLFRIYQLWTARIFANYPACSFVDPAHLAGFLIGELRRRFISDARRSQQGRLHAPYFLFSPSCLRWWHFWPRNPGQ